MKWTTVKIKGIMSLFCFLISHSAFATTLEVGPGKSYSSPAQAAQNAQPGDTVLIFPSIYTGSNLISNLHGNANAYIYFLGTNSETVIFQGGSQGLHFSQVSYIHIEGLSFTKHTGNGMNIDDGGTFATPTHHVKIINCRFYDMGAQGNNDFLKMSGVDHFDVVGCTFRNGANGGSGIDMVGCHQGKILRCRFDKLGSNCIQAKGGTQHIDIFQNWFEDGGQRALNLGGSTSLEFFRPQNAPFEAADLNVYANVFVGGWAPVAFVGCVRVHVVNNTFITPQNWVMRILQETVNPARFLPCGDNSFVNNIIYFNNSLSTFVNIGPNTNAGSFVFSNNLWYNFVLPANSTPNLPVMETNRIAGSNPLFTDVVNADFRLSVNSPAINAGTPTSFAEDHMGTSVPQGGGFDIGAYEWMTSVSVTDKTPLSDIVIYPNPVFSNLTIEGQNISLQTIHLLDLMGNLIQKGWSIHPENENKYNLQLEGLPQGVYILKSPDFTKKFIKI
ncbi:MAG: right-handed parallel beta-helix repeat-containing protein [Saprospiraceae bacterium]|nr:right-handed parallel beta-helix repeat-containing protein [Saprospiraceae bacterium]